MKCLGRTRTWRRCSRDAKFLFCHDHRWVFWLSIIPFLILAAELREYYLVPAYHWLMPSSPRNPRFTIYSTPVEVPVNGEKAVPMAIIQNRKLHTLEVVNPNKIPLSNLQLRAQFPEAILEIRSPPSANYTVVSIQDWDSVPVQVGGDISNAPPFEPFAPEEPTGLWRITVSTIPPNSTIRIQFLTATGPEGGLYTQAMIDDEPRKAEEEILWLLQGSYQFIKDAEYQTEQILVPLAFDRQSRLLTALAMLTGSSSQTNAIIVRHGRGFRLPGVLRTSGYVLVKSRNGTMWTAVPQLERTDNIAVAFGMFGPSLEPGVWLRVKSPHP